MDPVANFAYSLIHTAPSPAGSGLSLKVEPGDGALFPTPGHFNAIVWPAGTRPLHSNAEIVRVTAIAGDEFVIERDQEGSSTREIKVGDQIMAGVTAKTISDLGVPTFVQQSEPTQPGPWCWLQTDGSGKVKEIFTEGIS